MKQQLQDCTRGAGRPPGPSLPQLGHPHMSSGHTARKWQAGVHTWGQLKPDKPLMWSVGPRSCWSTALGWGSNLHPGTAETLPSPLSHSGNSHAGLHLLGVLRCNMVTVPSIRAMTYFSVCWLRCKMPASMCHLLKVWVFTYHFLFKISSAYHNRFFCKC